MTIPGRWRPDEDGAPPVPVRPDTVAVLPTAAIEQHGPHLPLTTDVDIGEGVLAAALERLPTDRSTLVLPTLAPGASPEHASFPGTLDRTPEGVIQDVFDAGGAVARAGVRRLVVFNSHGGNRAAIDIGSLRLRRRYGLLVVKVHTFRLAIPPETWIPEAELRHGLHGGAVETSIMLHLHPDRVVRDRMRAFPSFGMELEGSGSRIGPEGTAAFAWLAEDLNAEGVTGDAALATPETGHALVRAWAGQLAAILEDARDFPVERLRHKPGRIDEP